MLRSLSLLGVAVAVALSLLAATSPGPAVGPGTVIDMHAKLFAALDRGDGKAAAEIIADGDSAVSLLVLGADGACRSAHGAGEMQKLVSELAEERKKQGGTFETKIVKSTADCDSERLSWGVFELETKHTAGERVTITRYAMTSIVRWTKDGMRLVHGHLSALVDAKR